MKVVLFVLDKSNDVHFAQYFPFAPPAFHGSGSSGGFL